MALLSIERRCRLLGPVLAAVRPGHRDGDAVRAAHHGGHGPDLAEGHGAGREPVLEVAEALFVQEVKAILYSILSPERKYSL